MGKLGTKYILLGIMTVSIFGLYAITTTTFTAQSDTLTTYGTIPYLMGHITMQVTDIDGNITSYIQTDNLVTNAGLVCGMALLTGADDGGCTSTSPFDNIGLGNGTNIASFQVLAADFTNVDREIARASADVFQDTFVVILNKTFTAGTTSTLIAGDTISETALLDGSGVNVADNLLARALLPSTTVVNGDEVLITWTLTGAVVP